MIEHRIANSGCQVHGIIMTTDLTQPPDLLFVTCGGTIDKIYFDAKGEYAVGPPQVTGLLEEANVGFRYEILPVVRKDSLEMTAEDREAVRAVIAGQRCRRVVVTHGTDTMIRTALALRGLEGRTIVLTGSMQPARFRVSDAEFNIGTAVMAAQILPDPPHERRPAGPIPRTGPTPRRAADHRWK